MERREFTRAMLAAWAGVPGVAHTSAQALELGLTETDAAAGLRAALTRGAQTAVAMLGRTDGFLGDPKVRIALPARLEKVAGLLRTLGQGDRLDELHTSMNRAAEAAVPQAKSLLVTTVKSLSLRDARDIITGGDTAATEFFEQHAREPLGVKFLPMVTQATTKLSLARRYNSLVAKAAGLGLIGKDDDSTIEQHVTAKALDGLFVRIGEEEKKIRQDPVATGSAILRRVFGVLR